MIILDKIESFINPTGSYKNALLFEFIILCTIIIISYFASRLIRFLFTKFLRKLSLKFPDFINPDVIKFSSKGVYHLLLISGNYLAISVFSSNINSLNETSKKADSISISLIQHYPFISKLINLSEYILFILLVIVVLRIAFNYIDFFFNWYTQKIANDDNKNITGSLFPLLVKIAKILVFLLGFVIVLAKLNIDISAFVVSLGVGSLAIALAAQETLSNMISGFIIMADRPFRIGDRIRIGTSVIGEISEIGIRSTKILDFDNNILVIPNNEIVKSQITNLSYPDKLTRVVVDVGVAYGSDIHKVKSILIEVANDNPLSSQVIPPDAFFMNFGESSLEFRLAVRTDDYTDAFTLGCQLREAIYDAFNKNSIEIPFPQRDVHIYNKN